MPLLMLGQSARALKRSINATLFFYFLIFYKIALLVFKNLGYLLQRYFLFL